MKDLNHEQKVMAQIAELEEQISDGLDTILAPLNEIESLEKQIRVSDHLQLSPGFEAYLSKLREVKHARSDMDDANAVHRLLQSKAVLETNNIMKMNITAEIQKLDHAQKMIWSLGEQLKNIHKDIVDSLPQRVASKFLVRDANK